MLCNCCEHRRQNIEDKQNKKPHVRQPRMECGSDFSVCGCYMWRPMAMPVFKTAPGDRRPVGGPSMIAARIRAERLAEYDDTICEQIPYGAKKNKEYVILRRLKTKEEKKEQKRVRRLDERQYARFQKDMLAANKKQDNNAC